MNPQSQYSPRDSDFSNGNLEELQSNAGIWMRRIEQGLRFSDNQTFQQLRSEIVESRDIFALLAPRLIELLHDRHPGVSGRATDLLISRPHWIGAQALNEMLIPCIRQALSGSEDGIPVSHLLFGLTPSAAEIDDQHVSQFFGMAAASVLCSPAPHWEFALLSLFGERVPETNFRRILTTMTEVVDIMSVMVRAEEQVPPLILHSMGMLGVSTVAGMYLLRHRIAERLDRSADERNWETELVSAVERYISDVATRIEQKSLPTRFEQYQLLLTYPLIVGANRDIATEQNLDTIGESLQVTFPNIHELLFRTRDPHLRSPSLDLLLNKPAMQSGSEHELSLVASLMLTTREFEDRSNGRRETRQTTDRTREQLEKLGERMKAPTLFPVYSECARIVALKSTL